MIYKIFLIKEIKKYPLFFLLLIFILTLGMIGLASINVVSQQVKSKLDANAKELLTSDIVVSARRDLLEDEKKSLRSVLDSIPHKTYKLIDIYSMIRLEKNAQSRLVEIRSYEPGFPFYGTITLENGKFESKGLYISQDLARLWGAAVGEELKVGEKKFKISGIVIKDSSQGLRGFSLAPRIYLPLMDVELTGLLRPGSTGSFAYHYLIPQFGEKDFELLKKNLLSKLPDLAVKVTLPKEGSEQTGRVIEYLTDFMSLSALVGLILSLVGIFYFYQSHLVTRLKDYCLYHLFGLQKGELLWGLILQFLVVFVAVSLIVILSINPLYSILRPYLSQTLGIDLKSTFKLNSLILYFPILFILSLSILMPLFFGLMRTSMGVQLKSAKISLGKFRYYDFIPFLICLWGFAIFLSHSFKIGSLFFWGLMLVFGVSTFFIKSLQWLLKKYVTGKKLVFINLEFGLAIRSFIHSGHSLTMSFLSLAIGTTLISLILQLDGLIQKEFILDEKKPSLFLFDIQEEQLDPLLQFSSQMGITLEGITPMIRARLEKVNGVPFSRVEESGNLRTREDEVDARMKNRGINLTYRQNLSSAEKLVEGEEFPSSIDNNDRAAFVSLEKRFAQRMGLKLGDKVTFDIQGVEIEGIVKNFREVKWTSFYPNFFVNVEPGFLEEAPKTFLAVLPQIDEKTKTQFQRATVENFSNVSFIDVGELIGKISDIFKKSRQAIEVISWLSLSIGFVILYGLAHDQVYRRYYDLALMKTLGFGALSLRKYLLIEFGLLFSLASVIGFFLGWLIAVLIGSEAFKLSWSIDWGKFFFPILLLSILCLVTILASSWRAIKAKPRELLSDS